MLIEPLLQFLAVCLVKPGQQRLVLLLEVLREESANSGIVLLAEQIFLLVTLGQLIDQLVEEGWFGAALRDRFGLHRVGHHERFTELTGHRFEDAVGCSVEDHDQAIASKQPRLRFPFRLLTEQNLAVFRDLCGIFFHSLSGGVFENRQHLAVDVKLPAGPRKSRPDIAAELLDRQPRRTQRRGESLCGRRQRFDLDPERERCLRAVLLGIGDDRLDGDFGGGARFGRTPRELPRHGIELRAIGPLLEAIRQFLCGLVGILRVEHQLQFGSGTDCLRRDIGHDGRLIDLTHGDLEADLGVNRLVANGLRSESHFKIVGALILRRLPREDARLRIDLRAVGSSHQAERPRPFLQTFRRDLQGNRQRFLLVDGLRRNLVQRQFGWLAAHREESADDDHNDGRHTGPDFPTKPRGGRLRHMKRLLADHRIDKIEIAHEPYLRKVCFRSERCPAGEGRFYEAARTRCKPSRNATASTRP